MPTLLDRFGTTGEVRFIFREFLWSRGLNHGAETYCADVVEKRKI